MEWKEGIAAIEGGSSVDKWEVEGVGASSSPRKGKEETGVAIESIKKKVFGGFLVGSAASLNSGHNLQSYFIIKRKQPFPNSWPSVSFFSPIPPLFYFIRITKL